MTTQELHIELDILLQKSNSNWNKNFLPQEKDLFINREVSKFIKQRLNPLSNSKKLSIFDTVKRTQDLNSLLKTVELDVVNINQKEVGYLLPFDFLAYISSEVNITPTCKVDKKVLVDKPMYNKSIKPIDTLVGLNICTITIIQGTITTLVFSLTDLPIDYIPQDNIQDYRKVFIYNNALYLKCIKNIPDGVEIKFNNNTEEFEFKSLLPFSIIYNINGIIQPVKDNSVVYKGYKESSFIESPIRISDEEFNSKIKRSYLSKSRDESIVGYLRETLVLIPKVSDLVQSTVFLTYLCKPYRIDLLLNCNSNLPNSVLEEVIANTAQTMKAVISSDTYEKFAGQNVLIE